MLKRSIFNIVLLIFFFTLFFISLAYLEIKLRNNDKNKEVYHNNFYHKYNLNNDHKINNNDYDYRYLNYPPGRLIQYLFNNRNEFKWKTYFYPENYTIVWYIESSPENLDVLISHIKQMKSFLESGRVPRPFDPLFKFEAIMSKYVETKIDRLTDTKVKIIKKAENKCAYYSIELHAKVVQNFFKVGRLEAMKVHELPDYIIKECKEYLEQN